MASFNDFLVDDAVPWGEKVKRTAEKLLLPIICKYFIICTFSKPMGFIQAQGPHGGNVLCK